MTASGCARAVALQAAVWKSVRRPITAVASFDALPWRTLVRTAAGVCSRAADAEPRACVVAASSRKRAARSRGTGVRAKTRPPTTSACVWPGRCALLWLCHSAPGSYPSRVNPPQNIKTARQKREQEPCVYSYHCRILGHGSYRKIRLTFSRLSTDTSTPMCGPARMSRLAILSPLPVLASSAQLLVAVVGCEQDCEPDVLEMVQPS